MLTMTGERMMLREVQENDWEGIHDYASKEPACRYQTWDPNTVDETKVFVKEALADAKRNPRTRYMFVINKFEEDKVIGAVEIKISDIHNRAGEIGYILNPSSWGNGFATEAARLAVGFGFKVLNLHRIYATCNPENAGSIRVLEKVGLIKEGTMRHHLKMKGGWRDSHLYSILENEWVAK